MREDRARERSRWEADNRIALNPWAFLAVAGIVLGIAGIAIGLALT